MCMHEWSVMITDWLLASLCGVLAHRLYRSRKLLRTISTAFVIGAVAALVGGLRHGIGPWLPMHVNVVMRFFSYALIVPAALLLVFGMLRAGVRQSRWLTEGTIISIVAVAVQQGVPWGTRGTLHNDLFHLLMMPAVYAFYRAAILLRETPEKR